MSDYLPGFEGEERRADLSQWYTPPRLAEGMAAWLLHHHPDVRSVLDPAAGRGALLWPLVRHGLNLQAWDIDPVNVDALSKMPGVWAHLADFRLRRGSVFHVDAVIANPPFEGGLDVDCIAAALDLAPVAVFLLRGVVRHGVDRWERLWRHVDIVREAVLIERPRFGGEFNPATDFVVLELQRAPRPRGRCEAMPPHPVEWW